MLRKGPGPSATSGSSFSAFYERPRHPCVAFVGRARAEQDEQQHHAQAARDQDVRDGVEGEERAGETILLIFFAPTSIIPSLPCTLPSSSASGRSAAGTSRCSSPPSRCAATICDNHGSIAYRGITGVLFRVRVRAVRRGKCSQSTRARGPCARRAGPEAPMRARGRSTGRGSLRCK